MSNLLLCLSEQEKQELKELLEIELTLNHFKDQSKTLEYFIKNEDMTRRLRNCLVNSFDLTTFVRDININDLRRLRNFGKKSLDEFVSLRGF
jgi:DNA-directed RNA polymerase alpha subunit